MIINGRHIDDGEAKRRLEEVRTATCQVPFGHPLRPVLDFLIGFIDAQDQDLEDAETDRTLLEEAKKTVDESEVQIDELETKLSEVQNNPDPALAPLIALNL